MNVVPTGTEVVNGLLCVCAEKDERTGDLINHGYKLIGLDDCYPYVNKNGQMVRQKSCGDDESSSLRHGEIAR